MASLLDVKSLLEKAASDATDTRITFYYSIDGDVAVHAGHIVASAGRLCRIEHRQLPPAQALSAIGRLRLLKVAALEIPLPATAIDTSGTDWLPLIDVLSLLDLAEKERNAAATDQETRRHAAATTPQAFSANGSKSEREMPDYDATPDPEPEPLDVAKEALLLLEPIFGLAAAKKIDGFASACPPDEKPHEFLLLCEKHAGMMLGNSKSNAMFRPLYERLSESRLKRRKNPTHH